MHASKIAHAACYPLSGGIFSHGRAWPTPELTLPEPRIPQCSSPANVAKRRMCRAVSLADRLYLTYWLSLR